MNKKSPRVSIGMPVFNGGNYLAEAIESILSQTYSDFELIISDNASTDNTENICRNYLQKDPRIVYHRNELNLGAAENFNRLVYMARGKYFKWAAHDDLIAPLYLEKCVEVLDSNQSMILCHTNTTRIDAMGQKIANYHPNLIRIGSKKMYLRFSDMIMLEHRCYDIFGLIRLYELKKTPLIGPYIGSDRNLLAELSLLGRFFRVPENMFFAREHTMRSTKISSVKGRMTWFVPNYKKNIILPTWRRLFEYIRSVNRHPIGIINKLVCYFSLLMWSFVYSRKLVKDFWIGFKNFADIT